MDEPIKKKRRQSLRAGRTTLAVEFFDADLARVRVLAAREERSVGFTIRKAVRYWLENSIDASPDAEGETRGPYSSDAMAKSIASLEKFFAEQKKEKQEKEKQEKEGN